MGVRVQVRRRHIRTTTVDEDQSRAPPGPADGVPCLCRNRCWISMGRCLADRGGLIPAAGLWRHGGQQPKEARRGWVYFHAFGFRGVLVGGSCRGIPRMGRPSVGVADWQAFAGHWGVVKSGKTAALRATVKPDQDLQRSNSDDVFQGLCSTTLPVPEVILI
jgi:hypothetical protein